MHRGNTRFGVCTGSRGGVASAVSSVGLVLSVATPTDREVVFFCHRRSLELRSGFDGRAPEPPPSSDDGSEVLPTVGDHGLRSRDDVDVLHGSPRAEDNAVWVFGLITMVGADRMSGLRLQRRPISCDSSPG